MHPDRAAGFVEFDESAKLRARDLHVELDGRRVGVDLNDRRVVAFLGNVDVVRDQLRFAFGDEVDELSRGVFELAELSISDLPVVDVHDRLELGLRHRDSSQN